MTVDSYNKVFINLGALQRNFQAIQNNVGQGVRVLSMIKSDAYGHGLVQSAKALGQVGASAFGVAEVDEGIALREAGVSGDILIFLSTRYYGELIDYCLTPVIFDSSNLRELSECAVKKNTEVGVHLKIDKGMGRLGIMPDEVEEFVREINELPCVYLAGIICHFPMADAENPSQTIAQNKAFDQAANAIIDMAGVDPPSADLVRHIANSAALIRFTETHFDMVRPGIALYGCNPSDLEDFGRQISLEPVMSFVTQVVQIKEVPADYGLSYGHVFVTKRPSRLAILPVGYANGFLRILTGKSEVMIRGRRAPVCGRICMNACVVDVTDIPDVSVLDEVVLMGVPQTMEVAANKMEAIISADEVAHWMCTINYEVLCLFGNSNQRVYI